MCSPLPCLIRDGLSTGKLPSSTTLTAWFEIDGPETQADECKHLQKVDHTHKQSTAYLPKRQNQLVLKEPFGTGPRSTKQAKRIAITSEGEQSNKSYLSLENGFSNLPRPSRVQFSPGGRPRGAPLGRLKATTEPPGESVCTTASPDPGGSNSPSLSRREPHYGTTTLTTLPLSKPVTRLQLFFFE